jgi:hypothetical protein
MKNTKKILVIALMVVLVSSVVAGAISFYSRPSTTNDNKMLLNARLNSVVNFCIQSLPNGTAVCDGQLAAAVNKICEENKGQMSLDACHDGKVNQYYKNRNVEIAKRNTLIKNDGNNSNNTVKGLSNIIPRK